MRETTFMWWHGRMVVITSSPSQNKRMENVSAKSRMEMNLLKRSQFPASAHPGFHPIRDVTYPANSPAQEETRGVAEPHPTVRTFASRRTQSSAVPCIRHFSPAGHCRLGSNDGEPAVPPNHQAFESCLPQPRQARHLAPMAYLDAKNGTLDILKLQKEFEMSRNE